MAFSRCEKKLGGAWTSSLEEGRMWPECHLVFAPGSELCAHLSDWLSISILQAVHAGMRALIYHSSFRGSQAEQSGMRTYYFSADTLEDMNAWIRAMNQAAQVLSRSSLKRSVLMEGPCQSASYARAGTQRKTLGCPNFHHLFTCFKHCPLCDVFSNNEFFWEEHGNTANNVC